jgi:hypothetical protein
MRRAILTSSLILGLIGVSFAVTLQAEPAKKDNIEVNEASLLSEPAVLVDLKLSNKQTGTMHVRQMLYLMRSTAAVKAISNSSEDSRDTWIKRFMNPDLSLKRDELTDIQKTRLREIYLQENSLEALGTTYIIDQLNITTDQQKQIAALAAESDNLVSGALTGGIVVQWQKENAEQMGQIIASLDESKDATTQQALVEKFERLFDELTAKIVDKVSAQIDKTRPEVEKLERAGLTILTAEQRETFRKMQGKKFSGLEE